MNYTFLPENEKKSLKREYRIRLLIVLCFFISVGIFIGICSLFPAYIHATLEERVHIRQVAVIQKTAEAATVKELQKEIAQSTTLLNTASDTIGPDVFYSAVSSIVGVHGNMKLTSFTLEHPSPTTMTVVVSGIAPTRNDLLSFKARLLKLPNSTSVDLPLSILAQDSKIPFSIQIKETLK